MTAQQINDAKSSYLRMLQRGTMSQELYDRIMTRLENDTPTPQYNQAFCDAIIAERRKLGETTQYVSIDECMRVVGRTFDSDQGDICHSSPVQQ